MDLTLLDNPAFWTKTVVQVIVLFNSLGHKNIDPNLGVALVVALEGVFHAVQSLVHVAHAVKDAIIQQPAAPK